MSLENDSISMFLGAGSYWPPPKIEDVTLEMIPWFGFPAAAALTP